MNAAQLREVLKRPGAPEDWFVHCVAIAAHRNAKETVNKVASLPEGAAVTRRGFFSKLAIALPFLVDPEHYVDKQRQAAKRAARHVIAKVDRHPLGAHVVLRIGRNKWFLAQKTMGSDGRPVFSHKVYTVNPLTQEVQS